MTRSSGPTAPYDANTTPSLRSRLFVWTGPGTNPYGQDRVPNPYGQHGSLHSPYRPDNPNNPYGAGIGVYRRSFSVVREGVARFAISHDAVRDGPGKIAVFHVKMR